MAKNGGNSVCREVGANPRIATEDLHFYSRLFYAELERRFPGGEKFEFSQNHDFTTSRGQRVYRLDQECHDFRVGDGLFRRSAVR